MKMVRNLLILAGAVALAVVVVLVLLPSLAPEEPEVTVAPTTPYEDLLLSGKATADVTKVTIDNENGRVVYYYDADEELWKLEGHEDVEIDQSTAKDIAYTAAYVSGQNVIREDLSDLAEYGLEDPAITVHTEFNDGSEITYYIGSQTPSHQSNYAYLEGGSRIVDLWMNYARNFRYTLDDLRTVNELSMSADNIVKVRLERKGQQTFEIADEAGDQSVSLYTWWVTEPWRHLCDTEELSTFLDNVAAITPGSVAAGDPGELSQYGLDEPSMTLYVENDAGESYTLYAGDAIDSSYTYIMIEGDPVVYSIGTSTLEAVQVKPFALTDKLLSLILINNVDSMHFTGLGAQCDITIEQIERKDENGETKLDSNGEPITDSQYTLDGAIIDSSAGSEFYQACLAVHLHSALDEEFTPVGAPDATLTYDLNIPGVSQYVFKFYEYKQDYYAVSINDEIRFKVLKEELQNVVSVLEGVRNGDYDEED